MAYSSRHERGEETTCSRQALVSASSCDDILSRCSRAKHAKVKPEIAGILQGCRLVSTARHAGRDHDAGAKRTVQYAEWVNLRGLPRETAVLHARTSTISEIGLTTDWRSCFEAQQRSLIPWMRQIGTAVCRKEASCGRKEKEEGSKGSGCKGSRDRQSSRGGKRKQRVWRSSAAFRLRVQWVWSWSSVRSEWRRERPSAVSRTILDNICVHLVLNTWFLDEK